MRRAWKALLARSGQGAVERAYEQAQEGRWEQVLADWRRSPQLATSCSRYQSPASGWTFLHQAAYFGCETACRELIRWGVPVGALSHEGQSAADVVEVCRDSPLLKLLKRATRGTRTVWRAPTDLRLLPSSCLWTEAVERQAPECMRVAYAGAEVEIPKGSRYSVDSFGRTLIGWHGSHDPPLGMDSDSMIDGA